MTREFFYYVLSHCMRALTLITSPNSSPGAVQHRGLKTCKLDIAWYYTFSLLFIRYVTIMRHLSNGIKSSSVSGSLVIEPKCHNRMVSADQSTERFNGRLMSAITITPPSRHPLDHRAGTLDQPSEPSL